MLYYKHILLRIYQDFLGFNILSMMKADVAIASKKIIDKIVNCFY